MQMTSFIDVSPPLKFLSSDPSGQVLQSETPFAYLMAPASSVKWEGCQRRWVVPAGSAVPNTRQRNMAVVPHRAHGVFPYQ
jgi:hypothetical protein